MKNIVIITHDRDEFNHFYTNGMHVDLYDNDTVGRIKLENGFNAIYIYNGPQDDGINIKHGMVASVLEIGIEKLIFTHRITNGLTDSFNVSTVAVDTDRLHYTMLFEITDRWEKFEEVWNYFSKKVERLQLKKSQEVYFNECIAESKWKELPEQFAIPIIIEKWNELNAKPFDSQAPDYDAFYKLVEDTWQE